MHISSHVVYAPKAQSMTEYYSSVLCSTYLVCIDPDSLPCYRSNCRFVCKMQLITECTNTSMSTHTNTHGHVVFAPVNCDIFLAHCFSSA